MNKKTVDIVMVMRWFEKVLDELFVELTPGNL